MKKCSGLFGDIFGHNFISLETKTKPRDINIKAIRFADAEDIERTITEKTFKIICKRCGRKG